MTRNDLKLKFEEVVDFGYSEACADWETRVYEEGYKAYKFFRQLGWERVMNGDMKGFNEYSCKCVVVCWVVSHILQNDLILEEYQQRYRKDEEASKNA